MILWKPIGKWGITSLGRGFSEFSFSTVEDFRSVLKSGLLCLFSWTPDFNPYLQRQTTTRCWIRILGLSQEYWRPKIIFAIAGTLDVPICLDDATSKCTIDRTFGHYTRVLVDVDLNDNFYEILVEREDVTPFRVPYGINTSLIHKIVAENLKHLKNIFVYIIRVTVEVTSYKIL